MDQVLADLIGSIAIKAIEIVGPAIVAALVAYKAASLQFRATLQQLREGNEFSARQHLFDYYKERQKRLSLGHKKLVGGLGEILGVSAAAQKEQHDDAFKNLLDAFSSMINIHLAAAPFEISLVLRDMKAKKMEGIEEYEDLERQKAAVGAIEPSNDFEAKKNATFSLIEAYGSLTRCNQLLLEAEINGLFHKYLERS